MSTHSTLIDPSLSIIIATSPFGLGHLRVTDALYHGLPQNATPILFGAKAVAISNMYRFISTHPLTRSMMEMVQMPFLDKPSAYVLRKMWRLQTSHLYDQLKTILDERFVVAKKALLVAAHPMHGHQLGEIKQRLAKELGMDIFLVVQVTDDTPQAIWYVYDADMIFVPSNYTKERLLAYAKSAKLPYVPIVVTAYPVSPLLTQPIGDREFTKRISQTDSYGHSDIHISIPVSGAAIGLSFLSAYMTALHQYSSRFIFHVISREAKYTMPFLQQISELPYIHSFVSPHDRTTIDNYEQVFSSGTISLEVTKPSEQAFKALLTPRQRGGAVLLISKPVGGQEYDNLHFLRHHGLMPGKHENHLLWDYAAQQKSLHGHALLSESHKWRALRLPDDPKLASAFTWWCLNEGIFARMVHFRREQKGNEVQSNGVEQFWTEVAKLISPQGVRHQK